MNTIDRVNKRIRANRVAARLNLTAAVLFAVSAAWRGYLIINLAGCVIALGFAVSNVAAVRRGRRLLSHPLIYLIALRDEFGGQQ